MAVNVETLDKLERKIVLELPLAEIQQDVQSRLKRLQGQVKLDGFRPGKVPMSVVSQRYGYSVQYEVINDRVGNAFQQAVLEAQLRVVGSPSITEKADAPEGVVAFEAVFEVFPEVQINDLSAAAVEKATAEVDDAAIDRTLDILRKQRRSFVERSADEGAQEGDRVTIDFEGKIDGEAFAGGQSSGFQFLVGEGQMLKEFEDAVRGMKVGESKTFPLSFPEDYHGKEVAGKQADFLVTLNKLEAQQLPEIDETFVAGLGVEPATVEALRDDIRKNLAREVKFRLLSRNKAAALAALSEQAVLDVPRASVKSEVERLIEGARAEMKQRGMPDADKAEIPAELFQAQAEQRVRMGLVVAELVKANDLHARPEQIDARITELAASYESPAEVEGWYRNDQRRMLEVEAMVVEDNVTEFVLARAQVTDKALSFEELMGQA